MLYQLPNGKVITLTVEEYLDLTDSDIQNLISLDLGGSSSSPWIQSAIKDKRSLPESTIDKSMDYHDEDEDKSHGDNLGIQEVFLDDLPDIPDTDL